MAQIKVVGTASVVYDGTPLDPRTASYVVNDTHDNYLKAKEHVAAGLVEITEAFTTVVNGEEQYLSVTVDLSKAANKTVGTHEVFTVTGAVQMKVLAECTTDVVGSANTIMLSFGDDAAPSGWIAGTSGEAIDAGEFWFGTTPARGVTLASARIEKIVSGNDIGYEIATAQASTGVIKFHCWYTALNDIGTVEAGHLSAMA